MLVILAKQVCIIRSEVVNILEFQNGLENREVEVYPHRLQITFLKKKCKCSLRDFTIIGSETEYHLRKIKESIFIRLHDYELNKQQKSTELFLF